MKTQKLNVNQIASAFCILAMLFCLVWAALPVPALSSDNSDASVTTTTGGGQITIDNWAAEGENLANNFSDGLSKIFFALSVGSIMIALILLLFAKQDRTIQTTILWLVRIFFVLFVGYLVSSGTAKKIIETIAGRFGV